MGLSKPKILIFIDWFLPGYKAGGPVKSVKNIVSTLSTEYDFRIITSDRDLGDVVPYPDIPLNEWLQRDNYAIIYLSPDKQNKTTYKGLIGEVQPDKIYMNSLFSFRFAIQPMLAVRACRASGNVIIAPRGMLGDGAIRINKTKKKIFLLLCKWTKFFKNVTWHATSMNEKGEIEKHIGKKESIKVAINLSDSITESWKPKKKQVGEVSVFFVSRISPKKNLMFALECLSEVKEVKVSFYIIGTNEDVEYWRKCQQYMAQLPQNIQVEQIGQIENSRLHNQISNYHFLLFPTFHENYGHVIVESFQAGCPVIISDQTPWHHLEEKQIGWDISLENKTKFVETIVHCANMTQSEYNNRSQKTLEFARSAINSPEIINQNNHLFQ